MYFNNRSTARDRVEILDKRSCQSQAPTFTIEIITTVLFDSARLFGV